MPRHPSAIDFGRFPCRYYRLRPSWFTSFLFRTILFDLYLFFIIGNNKKPVNRRFSLLRAFSGHRGASPLRNTGASPYRWYSNSRL